MTAVEYRRLAGLAEAVTDARAALGAEITRLESDAAHFKARGYPKLAIDTLELRGRLARLRALLDRLSRKNPISTGD